MTYKLGENTEVAKYKYSYDCNGNAKITSESDDFGRTTEIKTSIKDEDDFVEK